MRRSVYIISAAFAVISVLSCQVEEYVPFDIDRNAITAPASGLTELIEVSSSDEWQARTNEPWILVNPTNGLASTQCKIRIDSALAPTTRTGSVVFSIAGVEKRLEITQEGYAKAVSVDDAMKEITIPDYDEDDNRKFDVEVTTNVPFSIDIDAEPGNEEWLKYEKFEFSNEASGYRPRKVTVHFIWGVNTQDKEFLRKVRFVPSEEGASGDELTVIQGAAPTITQDRHGDSLAILAINRKLKAYTAGGIDENKPMENWSAVTLYPMTYEKKEFRGRVRTAKFFILDTKNSLPFEVKYLKAAEELSFYGNANHQSLRIDLGPEICELKDLKKLTIGAYGLASLPDEMENMTGLEDLRLTSNCFTDVPDVLFKMPNLRILDFSGMRIKDVLDLSNTVAGTELGYNPKTFPVDFLKMDYLDTLQLSYNYLEGHIPTDSELLQQGFVPYTEEYVNSNNLSEQLIGAPMVLPDTKSFSINLNRLTGDVSKCKWLLYHPHIKEWFPYTYIFNQEGKTSEGKLAGFEGVPETL